MDGDVRILSSPTTCFLLYIYQKYVQRFVLETFSLIVICLLIYTKEQRKKLIDLLKPESQNLREVSHRHSNSYCTSFIY